MKVYNWTFCPYPKRKAGFKVWVCKPSGYYAAASCIAGIEKFSEASEVLSEGNVAGDGQ